MRNRFRSSPGAPVEVVRRALLQPDEKVLAACEAREATWLLGTRDALHVVPATGPERRVDWERVERADWSRDDARLRISEVGEFGHPRPVHVFEVDEPGVLLQLVRERVTASVVLQRRVLVSGRKGLYVIARRPPGGTGEITWAYEFDKGLDPSDPGVMDAAEEGLRRAAQEIGL